MRRKQISALGVALGLLALAGIAPAQETQETYVLWGDPQKGRQAYAQHGCPACHAIQGVGGTAGPDLGRPPIRHETVTQIAGIMWNHAPEMRRMAQARGLPLEAFTGTEMLDLLTYLYSLHFLDQPGNTRRGERLFKTKGCAACHAPSGDRPSIGPPLAGLRAFASPILWAEVMWNHGVRMEAKMKELGLAWPKFEDNEMVDLITYVRQASGR